MEAFTALSNSEPTQVKPLTNDFTLNCQGETHPAYQSCKVLNVALLRWVESWIETVSETYQANRGGFVEQKLMLSSSFRRDLIHNVVSYEPGHTLLCCLSLTQLFNKPASE